MTLQQLGMLLVDWTDPLKVMCVTPTARFCLRQLTRPLSEREGVQPDDQGHLTLAFDLVQAIASDVHGMLVQLVCSKSPRANAG